MSYLDDEGNEPEWVESLKHAGPFPIRETFEQCSKGWTSPPPSLFMVRGTNYLTDKVKQSAAAPFLRPLAFDWLQNTHRIDEIMKHPNNRVSVALDAACREGEYAFVWCFNFQIPSKEYYSAVAYFISYEPPAPNSIIDRFLKNDDHTRNKKLKLIANIVKGPWIVRTAMGDHAICILGKSLNVKYIQGENYMEIDIDIASSLMATAILHLALGYITEITIDLAFVIEGQIEEDLPERILGAIRCCELDLGFAIPLDLLGKEGTLWATTQNSSLGKNIPTRIWQQIGEPGRGVKTSLKYRGSGSGSNEFGKPKP